MLGTNALSGRCIIFLRVPLYNDARRGEKMGSHFNETEHGVIVSHSNRGNGLITAECRPKHALAHTPAFSIFLDSAFVG